jgi:hypothetical protein
MFLKTFLVVVEDVQVDVQVLRQELICKWL